MPGVTCRTEAYAIAHRLAARLDEIEIVASGIDDDRAGPLVGRVVHLLPQETWIDALVGDGRQREIVLVSLRIHGLMHRIEGRQAIGLMELRAEEIARLRHGLHRQAPHLLRIDAFGPIEDR